MPFPIVPINDSNNLPDDSRQDISGLIPLLISPMTVLQDIINGQGDKDTLKDIWLKSESLDSGSYKVSSTISDRDLWELRGRGLIEGSGREVTFTEKGEKILRESILDDEKSSLSKTSSKSSLVKKASKKLIAKNSYDFGNEVLVRTNKEKFGSRYITVSKEAFKKKKASPRQIDKYEITTKKANGLPKDLHDYTEEELVQVLHLSKRIVANHNLITKRTAAEGQIPQTVPVNRIKAFTTMIMEELNSR